MCLLFSWSNRKLESHRVRIFITSFSHVANIYNSTIKESSIAIECYQSALEKIIQLFSDIQTLINIVLFISCVANVPVERKRYDPLLASCPRKNWGDGKYSLLLSPQFLRAQNAEHLLPKCRALNQHRTAMCQYILDNIIQKYLLY